MLRHRYMIPSGFYQQMWCWDTAFMGAGSLTSLPSAPLYLADAMKNYFELTDAVTGELPGCVTPNGFSPTLRHAKPVLIWAAYCAARASGDFAQYKPLAPKMEALLKFWSSGRRFDAATGLSVWFDIMETGADDLPWYEPASIHTPGWTEEKDAYRVAAPDLVTFLVREHRAMALFLRRWAEEEGGGGVTPDVAAAIGAHNAKVAALKVALNTHLWHWADEAAGEGWYCAYDVRTRSQLPVRTYQAAWPLWERLQGSRAQADAAVRALLAPDMRCASGVRSTSSAHPAYSNTNMITPYSNWRGPVWINVNCVLAYALMRNGYQAEAEALARDVVRVLADDLRANGEWHECYHADDASVYLAAPGFLSWNMMGAELWDNIVARRDPMALDD